METEKFEEMIIDFINGEIGEAERVQFLEHLANNEQSQEALNSALRTWEGLKKIEVPEPSPQMDNNFYQMLNEHKRAETEANWLELLFDRINLIFHNRNFSRYALGAFVLLIGISGVYWLNMTNKYEDQFQMMTGEIQEMKSMMMVAMLEKESPTERLKAVSLTREMADVNEVVADALLNTLNNDENDNVRLAALDALYQYGNNPRIREGLIKSISNQTSPLVQIGLAEVMVSLQEKRSVVEFHRLFMDGVVPPEIKEEIEKNIKVLI
ncbi:HEAT repeat domain-containing protein [Fulvivirgaceae bacterium BMA10]|uniref:HEAT repeat domain-containing protein n=1 Tax=Splendidivirga corallicola TaxID=3051826 RepID=A0ABT8KS14_9BACT|nr:HEAT repeat domain-containing protein [Fulvivirgaceae bacterium BMA10]